MSFNYDRVVERLTGSLSGFDVESQLIKLHGTAPTDEELTQHLRDRSAVTSIHVPGPSKLAASQRQEWESAATALKRAYRLVVIGYSFPESDALARSLVLRNFGGPQVAVVLGTGAVGADVCKMFRHLKAGVVNTELYGQSYLTDRTARAADGKFMHSIWWSSEAWKSAWSNAKL